MILDVKIQFVITINNILMKNVKIVKNNVNVSQSIKTIIILSIVKIILFLIKDF